MFENDGVVGKDVAEFLGGQFERLEVGGEEIE